MATIVSLNEIGKRFKQLGWDNIPLSDIPNWLTGANIPAADLIAYLDAAVLAPAGWQDAVTNGAKITSALKKLGVVV